MNASPRMNALTVDVEEYFQVSAFEDVVGRGRWPELESRVVRSTERLLDLFDAYGARGTFFVLGWVARRHPALVQEIATRGHELASHGDEHRLVTSLDAEGFREDLRRAAEAIEAAAGVRVKGFRAPSFSFSRATPWAHDVLCEEGYAYSSSVFPVRHDRYGIPDFPRYPVRLAGPDGRRLWEFPLTTWRLWGRNLPVGGGGWLRAWPGWVTRRAVRAANVAGWPAVVYVHPWEVDPEQPRIPGARWMARFRHELNLHRTVERLEGLLSRFRFGPVGEILEGLDVAA